MTLDPQAAAFLEMMAARNLPKISEVGTAARYNGHGDLDMAGPLTPGVEISHRFVTSPTADNPVRIYTPQGSGPFGAMVYFHGGGWVFGHIDRYDAQLTDLAKRTNSKIISVNYQKSPEHKFPIPHDDCYATLKWVVENAAELSIDPRKIGVAGDSAGGNLAAGVALRARDEQLVALAYQLLIYPAVDMNFDTPSYLNRAEGYGLTRDDMIWFLNAYIDPADRKNAYALPLHASTLAGVAPAIVITAEYDVLTSDGINYVEKLKGDGVSVVHKDFAGQIHGFFSHGKYVDQGIAVRGFMADQIKAAIGG